MRIIKLGLLSFGILFCVLLFISLLFPSHIRLSKATNVVNKKDSLLSLVSRQDQWPRWHPAFVESTSAGRLLTLEKKVLQQTDSTFMIQLQAAGKAPVINGWQVFGTPTSDSLTIQWYMDFKLGWYPWQKFSSLFFEQTYGRMMQQGLTNIKVLLEK